MKVRVCSAKSKILYMYLYLLLSENSCEMNWKLSLTVKIVKRKNILNETIFFSFRVFICL